MLFFVFAFDVLCRDVQYANRNMFVLMVGSRFTPILLAIKHCVYCPLMEYDIVVFLLVVVSSHSMNTCWPR